MSKFLSNSKTTTDKECPNCLRPVKKNLDFCLECGDFVEPTGTRSGKQAQLSQGRSGPRLRRVHSPVKTPILLIAALLGCILIALFALTVYECCTSYDASHKDLLRLAQNYLASGDEQNAVNVLERSLLEEKHPKQEERRALLDQSLYALGAKLVSQGKYRDAVTCYARISASFERHDEVEKLIAEYTDKALPVFFDQGSAPAEVNKKEKSQSMSRLEKAVMTVVPAPTASKSGKISGVAAGAAALKSFDKNDKIARPVNAEEDRQVSSMARYNDLLAGYFAKNKGQVAAAVSVTDSQPEPPSYEEWVKSGNKDF